MLAGIRFPGIIPIILVTLLAGGAARAETAPICAFKQTIAGGKSVRSGAYALFTGPRGTGKTMTAKLLAESLRQPLYRVDLSAIVGKYIGETEKNLDKVFDSAARSDAVLFFDEADALFGKRTDTKDSHDRYANAETTYLLKRIETHDGVVLLATNLRPTVIPRGRKAPVIIKFAHGRPAPRDQLNNCK
jgi:SpoVK/Ycf46/Vps4 family AAA+-type ATPase